MTKFIHVREHRVCSHSEIQTCQLCVNEDQPNERNVPGLVVKKLPSRTSLLVQWLGPRAPNTGGMGSIPDQGTRSHVLQLSLHAQLKIPCTKKKKKEGDFFGDSVVKESAC